MLSFHEEMVELSTHQWLECPWSISSTQHALRASGTDFC
jgi:hypothetical protein